MMGVIQKMRDYESDDDADHLDLVFNPFSDKYCKEAANYDTTLVSLFCHVCSG